MPNFYDAVNFLATSSGTGDFVVASAIQGYRTPLAAAVPNGATSGYYATSTSGNEWELGITTYATGTVTAARTTVIANHLGTTAKVSFTAAPNVAFVELSRDMLGFDFANSFTAAQRVQGRANLGAAINELQNVSFAVSASAGALTIALKDAGGNDATATTPIALTFRNASLTASPNVPTTLEITAASSVVVPSTSTLGTTSAVACRLWIIGWNDGGTFRLGVFNASSGTTIYALNEYALASSLQVVAAGNSAGQHYTAGAAVTSKAFRILGFVDWNSSGVATAGTWTTTNLNSIQTFGPGVPRPGTPTGNTIYFQTNTFSTTTGASYVASVISVSITPSNAANCIKISWGSDSYATASSASLMHLRRGAATQIGPTKQNFFSSVTGAAGCGDYEILDFPNTVAATTYGPYFSSSGGGAVYLPYTRGSITLTEIMG